MHSRRIQLITFGAVTLLVCSSSFTMAGETDWLSSSTDVATSTSDEVPTQRLPIRKVAGSLAVVLGSYLLLTLLLRKQTPTVAANEMMEPLGSVQVAPKVRLHLVRFGSRILVLHISGANVQRVAELDDAQEVERLLAGRGEHPAASLPVSVDDLLQSVGPGEAHLAQGRFR